MPRVVDSLLLEFGDPFAGVGGDGDSSDSSPLGSPSASLPGIKDSLFADFGNAFAPSSENAEAGFLDKAGGAFSRGHHQSRQSLFALSAGFAGMDADSMARDNLKRPLSINVAFMVTSGEIGRRT